MTLLFDLAHLAIAVTDDPETGVTFGIVAREAVREQDRRPLFSGHVEGDTPAQLRAIANCMDSLLERRAGQEVNDA